MKVTTTDTVHDMFPRRRDVKSDDRAQGVLNPTTVLGLVTGDRDGRGYPFRAHTPTSMKGEHG